MLSSQYEVEQTERVGFMTGLTWSRNRPINFYLCQRQWYGAPEHENIVFRTIHRQIQITRDLPQHIKIQKFNFTLAVISLVGFFITILGVISLQLFQTFVILPIGPLIGLSVAVTKIFYQCGYCGNPHIKDKIKQVVYKSNFTLSKYGYQVKFARYENQWCYCNNCCCCCANGYNFSTIQIFDINSKRDLQQSQYWQQQLSTLTRPKTEVSPH